MATTGRQIDPSLNADLARMSLEEALEQEPFAFDFFQAVRLLQRFSPEREMVGKFVHPNTEVVKFRANPSMTFPASEIQAIDFAENEPARLTVNFMGLTGPLGVMPLCYTEFVINRLQNRDSALRDFLDLFNHRIISLFYQAWEKYHFTVPYERG